VYFCWCCGGEENEIGKFKIGQEKIINRESFSICEIRHIGYVFLECIWSHLAPVVERE
jgi:hypothetical protein